MLTLVLLIVSSYLGLVSSHASIWTPSMYGFNVTRQTFSYDNRPVAPLMHRSFSEWWFHGHLDHPPHPEDVTELPAGQDVTMQVACNKGATTYYNSSEGGNVQDPNDPNNVCPGKPPSEYHTIDESDAKGCALAIAYKSNAADVTPEDFVVFTVNHVCVWNRYTNFPVPKDMPPCPNNMCTCAFFWIHSPDSGSEQNYMNGFQCRVTKSTSNVGLATPKVARRCGADPSNGKPNAAPGNCTYGAKQPFYWYQAEQNNMFEGSHAPPFYNDLYNFVDGAQNDIFQDYYESIPTPGPNQTALPVRASSKVNAVVLPPPASSSEPTHTSTSTSASPSKSPSELNAACPSQPSPPARRNVPVEWGTGSTFAHRALGMTRRRKRTLTKPDLWKPF